MSTEVSKYLASIGRKGGLAGGKSQSKPKAAAARVNGKLGGRPRKNPKPPKEQKIKIRFRSREDLEKFFERIGQPLNGKGWHEVRLAR